MARDWEDREGYGRGYRGGEQRFDRDRDRDWDRPRRESQPWYGSEEMEGRRTAEDRYRDRESASHFGGGGYGADYGGPAGNRRPFTRRDAYPGYDRPWSNDVSGGFDRDAYGYPRRRFDDEWGDGRQGGYRSARSYGNDWDEDRGFFERAGDEVASWFGDDDAARRREMDARYRGRGPKNYTRSDERISEDVNDRLADDAHIDASGIEVSVSGGEVTLNGTVTERFAKRHAEDLAERVSGVKHVQNNLRVAPLQSSNETGEGVTSGGLRSTTGVGASATARH